MQRLAQGLHDLVTIRWQSTANLATTQKHGMDVRPAKEYGIPMQTIIARPNSRFLMWMLVLLPATFGLGSLVLWLWHRSFVHKVDSDGIYLWSGKFVAWKDVKGILTRKSYADHDRKVLRLDVLCEDGRAIVMPNWLENGPEMVDAVRSQVRQALPSDARLRAHYVQRR